MTYAVYLRREALDFLRECRREDRDSLLNLLDTLANDPFQKGDFAEKDQTGRTIEVLIFRRYAILYWPDHPVKEVKIVDLRFADR
jgi:hypothetical protein